MIRGEFFPTVPADENAIGVIGKDAFWGIAQGAFGDNGLKAEIVKRGVVGCFFCHWKDIHFFSLFLEPDAQAQMVFPLLPGTGSHGNVTG